MFVRLLILILVSFILTGSVNAKFDPRTVPNNKYGFHIADTNDVAAVANLVNTEGGDWGYITLVIPSSDRNTEKWQNIFNEMRRLHLIPLVRLAGQSVDDFWTVPEHRDIEDWVSFLNSLNWPVENRYVILFNETNHAKEWGNEANPEGYAEVFVNLASKLKDSSEDFFILSAAMDVSASSDQQSMDASVYLTRMITSKPEILDLIDGINSHSYPNPAFSGSPSDNGRGTLKSYVWEKQLMKNLGLTRDLPVFITETGWQHSNGKRLDSSLLNPERVSEYVAQAAAGAWSDPSIVAVTPFVFNYQDYPFDHFSWRKLGSDEYYPMYNAYGGLKKEKGKPNQREKYGFVKPILPDSLVSRSHYTLGSELKNDGQNIVHHTDGYELVITSDADIEFTSSPLSYIEPGEQRFVAVSLKTPEKPGTYAFRVSVVHDGKSVLVEEKDVVIVPPPSLTISLTLGWRKGNAADDTSILIYDLEDHIIHKFTQLATDDGDITLTGLTDIIPGDTYRIVALVPFYLPRQHHVIMTDQETTITMPRSYPVDVDRDGALTVSDVRSFFFTNPAFLFRLSFGP